jgi:ASTRA-associated protein 1
MVMALAIYIKPQYLVPRSKDAYDDMNDNAVDPIHVPLVSPNSIPAGKAVYVIAGYEGGHTAVHALKHDMSTWNVIYMSGPHSQPILSLDIAPRLEAYFTSGADAILAAHPLSRDKPPLVAVTTEDANPRSEPMSKPKTMSNDSNSLVPPFPSSSASSGSPSIAQSNVGPQSGLSALLLQATPPNKLSSSSVTSHTSPFPDRAHQLAVPLKINNTKHAGQQGLRVRNDGRIIASGGWDGRVRIYSTKTLREMAVLKWHDVGVYCTAFAKILDDEEGVEDQSLVGIRSEPATDGGHSTHVEEHKYGDAIAGNETNRSPMKAKVGLGSRTVEREKKAQRMHYLAAGAKDGKVSLWEVF